MEINTELIDKLAHLSRLHFDDSARESIRIDLEKMMDFVGKLAEVDTSEVTPLLHISDTVNVLREDSVAGSVSRTEALLNSPEKDTTFFKVPKVIRK